MTPAVQFLVGGAMAIAILLIAWWVSNLEDKVENLKDMDNLFAAEVHKEFARLKKAIARDAEGRPL